MKKKFLNIIQGTDVATILLYGDVGDGEKVDSSFVVEEILSLEKKYNKIDVRINSRGGDVFNGMAIYNALRHSTSNITIYVDGIAASIAAIIALCGKPIYMSPYARLMLHCVSGGTYGNASEMRQMADQMEALQLDLSNMIAGKCGMTAKNVQDTYFDEKDHWIDSKKALSMHLIDGIYDLSTTEINNTEDGIYQYFNNRLNKPQTQKSMALIDDIKMIPSFKDKDDGAVIAHIKELENKALSAESLRQANAAYQKRIQDLENKEIESFLNKAVEDGKITKDQIPSMRKLMNVSRTTTEELINTMKKNVVASRAADVFDDKKHDDYSKKSWDELDKENKLSDLKNSDFTLFCTKYKDKFGIDYNN